MLYFRLPLLSLGLWTLPALAAAHDTLLPYVFEPLPLGSIKPEGWLYDTMRSMGDGLAGHQFDFYVYVRNSTWIGGDKEYSELAESAPYWFNYIVPLAYGLDDARLKLQVKQFVEYVIAHQGGDGWIGPHVPYGSRDLWPRFPFMLGLTQLLEADPSYAKTVVPAMHRFSQLLNEMLRRQYDGYIGWGRARGQDMIMALQWLLENYPEDQREILFDNMRLLKEAAFDWPRFFSEDVFPMGDLDTIPSNDLQYDLVHVVNLGQALKSSAIVRRYTHNDVLLDTARNSVNWTFIYHGAPSGAIIGDERISGVSPTRGTELCSVVETMFSLSYLYKAIGDRYFADRCELAAFNALPVMISPDSWAHQYVAQSNQPYSIHLKETPFWNVNDRGQTFGLEPHFPCCTVNHPQGYPKFASNMFVKAGTNGIGHALLSPGRVRYLLNQDNKVDIRCQTHYPFGQSLEYTIIAQKSFDFYVRVPEWYLPQDSYVRVNGGTPKPLRPDPETGMHKIVINKTITVIQYHLGAEIKVENRQNETVAIHYGPLLYALEITTIITSAEPSDWNSQQTLPQSWYTEQTRDYTISNTSAWAYAIDTSTLKFYSTSLGKSPATTSDLPNPIFQQGAPPTFITVQACEVAWGYSRGVPAEPPLPGHRRCTSKPREVKLIPYGAAKIHIAEFPVVDISSPRETIFNGDKTQQVLAFHD